MLRKMPHLLIIAFLLFAPVVVLDANANTNLNPADPEKTAMDFFEEGRFSEALPLFREQLRLYPDDKMLNYYLGACLVEIGTPDSTAFQALQLAIDKNSPDKINYYLAVTYHAVNDFSAAIDYYRRFEQEAKSKTLKTTNYQQLIEFARQSKNPFVTIPDEKPVSETSEYSQLTQTENTISTTQLEVNDTVRKTIAIEPSFFDSLINFQATAEIKYLKLSQFRTVEGRMNYVQGWNSKLKIDSLVSSTENLRKQYSESEAEKKEMIASQILGNEQKVIALNREMPQFDLLAHQYEDAFWAKAFPSEKDQILQQNQALVDSIEQVRNQKTKLISQQPPEIAILPVVNKKTTPEAEPTEKGIVYKIQIGAFSKEPPDYMKRIYKKLSLIRKIDTYTDEKGVTVYTVGLMKTYADALLTLRQVKTEGVKNASIAAYNDKKRINVNEARKLNKE